MFWDHQYRFVLLLVCRGCCTVCCCWSLLLLSVVPTVKLAGLVAGELVAACRTSKQYNSTVAAVLCASIIEACTCYFHLRTALVRCKTPRMVCVPLRPRVLGFSDMLHMVVQCAAHTRICRHIVVGMYHLQDTDDPAALLATYLASSPAEPCLLLTPLYDSWTPPLQLLPQCQALACSFQGVASPAEQHMPIYHPRS